MIDWVVRKLVHEGWWYLTLLALILITAAVCGWDLGDGRQRVDM